VVAVDEFDADVFYYLGINRSPFARGANNLLQPCFFSGFFFSSLLSLSLSLTPAPFQKSLRTVKNAMAAATAARGTASSPTVKASEAAVRRTFVSGGEPCECQVRCSADSTVRAARAAALAARAALFAGTLRAHCAYKIRTLRKLH